MRSKDSDYFASKAASRGSKRDLRLTNCKICKLGIFDGQPTVWLTTPLMGLAHRECANATRPATV